MALTSSGALSLNDIQGEWGGSNPIGMSEYYGDGDYVFDGAVDGDGNAVPESGALDISDFYDTTAATVLTIDSNTNNYNIASAVQSAGADLNTPVLLTINSGVTVGSTDSGTAAMYTHTGWGSGTSITITNNGSIVGAAGSDANANPSSGGGQGGQPGSAWGVSGDGAPAGGVHSPDRGYPMNGESGDAGQNGSGSAGSAQQGGDAFTHSQTANNNLSVVFATAGTRTAGAAGTLTTSGNGGGGGGGGSSNQCFGGGGGGGAANGQNANAQNYQNVGNTSNQNLGSDAGSSSGGGGGGCMAKSGGAYMPYYCNNTNYHCYPGGAGGGLGQAGTAGRAYISHQYGGGPYNLSSGSGGSAGSAGTNDGQAGAALSGNTGQIS
jgi:hypothetical protein